MNSRARRKMRTPINKLSMLLLILVSCNAMAHGGISSLGALLVPLYILVISSTLLGFLSVFHLYKKHKRKWLWLLLPVMPFAWAVPVAALLIVIAPCIAGIYELIE
jgi:hypothetical protein